MLTAAKPKQSTTSSNVFHPSISVHPAFHNIDEAQAKSLLNNASTQGNFLFIKGKQNSIILVYKALYKGSGKVEIRTLSLNYSYDKNQQSVVLQHSSLGTFTNLSAAAEKLPDYLKDFVIGSFTPIPVVNNNSKTKSAWKSQAMPLLQNSDAFVYILRLTGVENLYKLRLVSKAWCAIVEECMPSFFRIKDTFHADLRQQRKKQVNAIFDAIQQKISPDREGHGDPNKMLCHNDFAVSQPTWYGMHQIICHVNIASYKGSIRINNARGTIELLHGELRTTDVGHNETNGTLELASVNIQEASGEIYSQLEEICKLGKNPLSQDVDANHLPRRP